MNEILLEYYQGKQPALIKCEKYLDEIIRYEKENEKSFINVRTHKASPANVKLENELTSFFKVKKINIYWATGMVNAMTITPSAFASMSANSAYKSGSYSDITIHMIVYTDLITKANLNAQELLAMMLHEIGHNFYLCPISAGFQLFYIVATFPIGLLNNLIQKLVLVGILHIEDFIKKEIPILYNSLQIIGRFFAEFTQILAPITNPVNMLVSLALNLTSIATNPMKAVNLLTGYGNEKGADSFAAVYGYGPNQASALRKMETLENMLYGKVVANDKGPVSIINDLSLLMCDLMAMMMLEPHPSNNQRAASMLKKLKRDLATNDYPKGMKQDLEKEIARMEKMYKIVNTNASKSDLQIRQKWYDTINTVTKNNSDFRELFSFYFDKLAF